MASFTVTHGLEAMGIFEAADESSAVLACRAAWPSVVGDLVAVPWSPDPMADLQVGEVERLGREVAKRRGRPAGWRKIGGVKEQRSLRLSGETWAKLEQLASVEGSTLTTVVERLAREA